MRFSLLITVFVLCLACNNEKVNPEKNTELPSSEGTSDVIDYIVPAQAFHQYLLLKDSSYTPLKYSTAVTTPLDLSIVHKTDTASLHPFTELLVYNSNRTKALDLFSPNYILTEKHGKIQARRGEPDTELVLIDNLTNATTRLLYLGPSFILSDAVWINDSIVGVTGGEIIRTGQLQPLLWHLDLTKKTVAVYRYTDTLAVDPADYFSKRYPEIAL